MKLDEFKAKIDNWGKNMTTQKALKVMLDERRCVINRYHGICTNKRGCMNCELAVNKDDVIHAYDFVIEKLINEGGDS